MYTKEQIETALKEFEQLGSVQAVINLLEYPSSNTLYRWYERKSAQKVNHHDSLYKPYQVKQKYINSPDYPRHPDTNLKLVVIRRCFSLSEGCRICIKRNRIQPYMYAWYRKYQKYGVAGLMLSKKQIKRENIDVNTTRSKQQDVVELQEQIKQLQMEFDVLKEALNLLKKTPASM